jgi:enoyl-CoA hydratase/carnithine racemase
VSDTSERVSVGIEGGVAEVRLERPDKRNALDEAMFAAIVAAGERLKRERGVRAVVLSGAGPSFCAGLDVSLFAGLAGGATAEGDLSPGRMSESGLTHVAQQTCWVWQELAVPVIAAVHGHAIGGGFQLALGADIRIVHPDAALAVREVHWGLIPDMTGTLVLSRLTRPDVAKELTMTARQFSGREAFELGIATRLSDDPRGDARALAAEIAGRSPDAVRASKSLVNRIANAGWVEQLAAERDAIGQLIGSPNQLEAVTANLERRPPQFTDPG